MWTKMANGAAFLFVCLRLVVFSADGKPRLSGEGKMFSSYEAA